MMQPRIYTYPLGDHPEHVNLRLLDVKTMVRVNALRTFIRISLS